MLNKVAYGMRELEKSSFKSKYSLRTKTNTHSVRERHEPLIFGFDYFSINRPAQIESFCNISHVFIYCHFSLL